MTHGFFRLRKNDALWRNYRLALLREEVCMNQPGASSAHSMEAIAYRVFGRQGCICLQHRPYLILAVDASIDSSVLPAALKEGKINVITAMTNPIQGLKELPDSYTQVLELYRHSYLFPDQYSIFPAHIEHMEQQWQLPYEDLYELFQSIGTDNSGTITQGISAIFHKRCCNVILFAIPNSSAPPPFR